MSLGYAKKLSYREEIGEVGMPEIFDSPEILQNKIEELAAIVQKSKHLVVFTGAGISTSSGIPDFRGPKGVWTLQRAGKGVPNASLPFHRAVPSMTHMALVELEKAGLLKFVISQNVDSLHLRSGFPREKLAELHGNSFKEICPCCKTEYLRDFEIETIGLKDTPRRCSDKNCGARLKDTVLDWEDALPPEEMNSAKEHCRTADLVLCLGTSSPHPEWTADRLARRNLPHPEQCLLCDQESETIDHILIGCVFAGQFWHLLLHRVGLSDLSPQPTDDILEDWWNKVASSASNTTRGGLNSLITLGAWMLWRHRNDCVLNGISPNLTAVLTMVGEEIEFWVLASAKGLSLLTGRMQLEEDIENI